MARNPRPWLRSERDEWRVTIRGVDHNLGPHPEGFPAPRRRGKNWNPPQPILDRFHELLVNTPEHAPAPTPVGVLSVADVFDKFLDWCQKHRSERSFDWYRKHIQSFCHALQARTPAVSSADFPAAQLRPYHVAEWLDGRPTWKANQRRGAIVAVTAVEMIASTAISIMSFMTFS
jgi:hypothetical protein